MGNATAWLDILLTEVPAEAQTVAKVCLTQKLATRNGNVWLTIFGEEYRYSCYMHLDQSNQCDFPRAMCSLEKLAPIS